MEITLRIPKVTTVLRCGLLALLVLAFSLNWGRSNTETVGALSPGFSDDFDDGDFTKNPTWELSRWGDCPTATAEVVSGELHFLQSGAGGCGNAVGLRAPLGWTLGSGQDVSITFDVKVVSSTVRYGTGDQNHEWPAHVWVTAVIGSVERSILIGYSHRGGFNQKPKSSGLCIIGHGSVTAGQWLLQESFSLQALAQTCWGMDATEVVEVKLIAAGWDYESYFDNIALVPTYAQINITNLGQYALPKTCFDVRDDGQNPLFVVCDNDFQGPPESHASCVPDGVCEDEDPAQGLIRVMVAEGDYNVVRYKVPDNHSTDPGKQACAALGIKKCDLTFINPPDNNPWFPEDIDGNGSIDLFIDIFGVANQFGATKP